MVVDYVNNQIEWFVNGKLEASKTVGLSDEPAWYVFVTLQDGATGYRHVDQLMLIYLYHFLKMLVNFIIEDIY
jgi:hypothetical protein